MLFGPVEPGGERRGGGAELAGQLGHREPLVIAQVEQGPAVGGQRPQGGKQAGLLRRLEGQPLQGRVVVLPPPAPGGGKQIPAAVDRHPGQPGALLPWGRGLLQQGAKHLQAVHHGTVLVE